VRRKQSSIAQHIRASEREKERKREREKEGKREREKERKREWWKERKVEREKEGERGRERKGVRPSFEQTTPTMPTTLACATSDVSKASPRRSASARPSLASVIVVLLTATAVASAGRTASETSPNVPLPSRGPAEIST